MTIHTFPLLEFTAAISPQHPTLALWYCQCTTAVTAATKGFSMTGDDFALTTLTRAQGNNRELLDGAVRPAGYRLEFADVPVLVHGFRRMVRELEFDVSEMALTTYLTAREHGVAFTALPIFLVRGFHHGAILRRTADGVTDPIKLEGRRVGVNRGYTVTTGVWARSVLATEYGVDLDRVTWVRSGDEHVESYRPPANLVSAPPGADLIDLLLAGELDAVIGVDTDRPEVTPLIPQPRQGAMTALLERGCYPINHLVVVKNTVLDQHRGVASALFDAFTTAKNHYVDRLRTGSITSPGTTDRFYAEVMAATGADPLPYGLAPNRSIIEELIGHATRQHILTKPTTVDELFAVDTLGLVG
jgi:4,5-dihydroxyphthalate decarboxylase